MLFQRRIANSRVAWIWSCQVGIRLVVGSLTDPLGPEQLKGDGGGAETSRLGGDDDLSFVIFGRTHAAHDLAGRHPFGRQQAVVATDGQT